MHRKKNGGAAVCTLHLAHLWVHLMKRETHHTRAYIVSRVHNSLGQSLGRSPHSLAITSATQRSTARWHRVLTAARLEGCHDN